LWGKPWPRRGHLVLAARCPTCDLHLERRELDFFLGAYTLSLFATLILVVGLAAANARWPVVRPPLRDLLLVIAVSAFAVGFYPFGKLLWLAVDLQFRPPLERDFDDEVD
jgi:hypothetical protein